MGFSASVELENEFSDRFWFWTGLSGKRYIHSVYGCENCPPLPGAIYIVVRRLDNNSRVPVRMGRFSPLWDFPLPVDATDSRYEIHVHLLAGDENQTVRVYDDLAAALELDTLSVSDTHHTSPVANDVSFTQATLPLFADIAA